MNATHHAPWASGWIGGALLLLCAAHSAVAQTVPAADGPAAQSGPSVTIGERVMVTSTDGSVSSGTVWRLSTASLTLTTRSGERTLPVNQIRLIRHHDSLTNGIVIGAVIGTGAMFPLASIYLGGDETPEPGTALGLLGLGAAAGALGGVLVDSLRMRVLYRAGTPASVAVGPAIVKGGGGVGVTVRW